MSRAPDAGFTLIEALVAMAILATSAVALLAAVEGHIGRIGDLERRTAARWAAETHLNALRLGLTPETRVDTLGYGWWVSAERAATSDSDLTRVTVRAAPADDPDAALVRLIGFLDTGEAPR